jgi:hypothetical protein
LSRPSNKGLHSAGLFVRVALTSLNTILEMTTN